ncbi:MAG: TonB-dependent receptor [Sphingomonadales bacterium]|nr:TonB-dependent receptor [Sphingomonadales bacterium]
MTKGVIRPASLRQGMAALGLTAALAAAPAAAQTTPQDDREVQLDTLKIQDRTADVNPYAEAGAPYKARVSGDARHAKPLAGTPQTITVVTETQIKESGRTDLKAILALQPGVTLGTGENGNKFGDRYILRGSELKSDVFVDGLRDPGMTIRESFNVEQVELTKGPSSTFAGRGSAGGAVNAITKQATTAYDFANVDATGGTDAYGRVTADVNKRLGDGFAIRVNGLYARDDVPDRGPAGHRRHGAAVSALLKPADSFSVLIDYYHLTARDRPDLGAYFTGAGGTVARDVPVYLQDTDFVRSNVDVLTSRIKWQLSDAVRIENAARYGKATNAYVTTGARGQTLAGTGTLVTTLDAGHQGWQNIDYLVDQLNLFARFTAAGTRHEIVLGGEISNNRVVNGVYQLVNNPATRNCATGTSATANAWCVLPTTANVGTLQERAIARAPWTNDWKILTSSLTLMDTVDIGKWLTLFGGVRLDHYTYTLQSQTVSTATGLVTSAAPTAYGTSGDLWNYHAGISLKPSDDGQFYFAFGTATNINGGESDVGRDCSYGGLCAPAATTTGGNAATNAQFYGSPVRTTNYELGTKWEAFGHKLLLTAAAFHVVKDGVFQSCPASDPLCPGTGYGSAGTLNTGRYKVDGVELGAVGNLTGRLSGQIGMTWLRSRILASVNAADLGRKLSNFADFQATAQLRYQLTDALALGGNVTHKSSMATGQPDTAAVYSPVTGAYSYVIPAWTTFDLFATYRINRHLEARVNVQNLGDKDYYLAGYRGGTFVYLGDKRRLTFTLTGKF